MKLSSALYLFVLLSSVSVPAHAYLLPLIGAGGAIITMLIGLAVALFSAIYLVFYNARRAMKKRSQIGSPEFENETHES